jgi:hypothetical protein
MSLPTFDSPFSVVSDEGPRDNKDERRLKTDVFRFSSAMLFTPDSGVDLGVLELLELYRMPIRAQATRRVVRGNW